uniref:MKRN2 opposite strand n=1 Tax=Oryctolagus cuniculus TaxID=9986 RepID=A0A5F9D858_RABIT
MHLQLRRARRCPLCLQDVGSRKLEESPPSSISKPVCPTGTGRSARSCSGRRGARFLGVVYNYSMHGVQRDEAGWEQSLAVPLLQPNMFGLMDQWDKYLEDFSTSGAWLPHRYDEEQHNCYSYALTFINCVLATEGRQPLDKSGFTEKYVLPKTRLASKYIALYRAIAEHGFCVADCPDRGASLPTDAEHWVHGQGAATSAQEHGSLNAFNCDE